MKKLVAMSAVLLLAMVVAVAQQPAADTSSNAPKTIRGCVGGSAGSYTLLDQSGMTYRLQGVDDRLKEHVGHEVEITGSETAGAASSPSSSTTEPAPGATGTEKMFTVSDIRHIAESCSVATTTPAPEPKPEEQAAAGAATQAQPSTTTDMSQQQAGSQPVSPDTSAQAAGTPTDKSTDQTAAAGTAAPSGAAEADMTAQQPATEPAVPPAQEQQPEVEQAPAAAAAEPAQQETETAEGQLPQTATPLPLLAILGLGSLAAGALSRKK